MEIIGTNMKAYAYTVKSLGKDLNANYAAFFARLLKFGIRIEYKVGERDSLGKWHYHGIIYLEKGFYRKKISLKGFHCKLVELHNKKGWVKYIYKDYQYENMPQSPSDVEIDDLLTKNCGEDAKIYKSRLF